MRRALLIVLAMAGAAHANGRPSATSTLHWRPGQPQEIAAGLTFGLVLSHDGGGTWEWMCEKAVGYGGVFDPDYAYTASGALFATTFDGLKVMRDGCVFGAAPPGNTFVSAVEVAPDGRVFYAAADPHDGNIYQSTDDGMTFPVSAAPGRPNDWWDSLVFANAQRVYLAGYRFQSHCMAGTVGAGDDCTSDEQCPVIENNRPYHGRCGDARKVILLMRSDDGGASFTPAPKLGLPAPTNASVLSIVGVDPANPDIVYARMRDVKDALYVSTDGALHWTKVLEEPERFSFVVRASGEIVVGTKLSGSRRSTDHGTTWIDLVNPPHIGCLYESPGGEVWACTQNYAQMMMDGMPAIPSDGYGIMKSTDLSAWTGVLRFQDIAAPVACPSGTPQHDQCVEKDDGMASVWCCLAMQMGITNPGADCSGRLACIAPGEPAPPRVDGVIKTPPPPPGGCCDAGAIASIWLTVPILTILRRRRR
jgi:photosystem II stability/assembly factor-like uncharacterized protein